MVLSRFKIDFSDKVWAARLYRLFITAIIAICLVFIYLLFQASAFAGTLALNTNLPSKNVNVPSSNLGKALATYAAQVGVVLVFDPILTEGKVSSALQGSYDVADGFAILLKGSGLEVVGDSNGEYSLQRRKVVVDDGKNLPEQISLKDIPVRAQRFYEVGPLPGLGLTKEEIPGNVQSITAQDIKEAHSLSITDLMNRKLQSVTVNDYQGNPFQMDVQYRGFTAGPQIGTPQGLSVFLDGVRVNEPFGDVVNWDMIPLNALAGVDVFPGSNPIFGLNTLGGAITMKTKDGFKNAGVGAEVLTGSYGRKYLQAEGGWNNGTVALFGSGNFFMEDGWRDNSSSKVNQAFGKASYRGEKLDLNFSNLLVWNDLIGNGLLPSEEYARNRNAVFTSPDTTDNRLWQGQLSGSYFVNDTFSITGQVSRRNSNRHQQGGDVFRGFAGSEALARRMPTASDQYTCLLPSHNASGIPDYYVLTTDANNSFGDLFGNAFFLEALGNGDLTAPANSPNISTVEFNKALSPEVEAYLKYQVDFAKNYYQSLVYTRTTNLPPPPLIGPTNEYGENEYWINYFDATAYRRGYPANFVDASGFTENYYYTTDSNGNRLKNYVFFATANNGVACTATAAQDAANNSTRPFTIGDPNTGTPVYIDGAASGQPGYVDGTPTSVITDNRINQITDGASVQLNWNIEHHKFMVGASIDSARATYSNSQQLGMLTADREAYLAPNEINPQFAGAFIPLNNNDFSGTNLTKSVYFSETWTPKSDWHFTASGRYNDTKTKNKVATRYGNANFGLEEFIAYPDYFATCPNNDCTGIPVNFKLPDTSKILDKGETEKFSYHSFNPSLGATWQARENLNLFVNVAQGARTPSVIELGCALDKTPLPTGLKDTNGDGIPDTQIYTPKSIVENRACTLPTTLSGDPYLPQIRSTSYDVGMRGTINERLRWNLGAYQTDLKDDIYFVAVADGRGFFDSIGKTRRRGIEAGLSGEVDRYRFSLNYALTDATFQEDFLMFSNDNSSARTIDGLGVGVINVKPGSRMPGTSLHNLNASVSYDVTDKWRVGMSAVVHSDSYVRGNENNEHRQGVARTFTAIRYVPNGGGGFTPQGYTAVLPPTTNPGTVPGYATFNFQTSYKFNKEWTAALIVNNVFDKEYFSAGRLGSNPFSPSINGAIGVSGFNYNSADWRSTNFIAPGAPRGIWISLRYEFQADGK